MKPPRLDSARSRLGDASDAVPPADALQQLLMQLWITSKATVAERLETICHAQTLLDTNALDEETRMKAQDAAHKLAGILGTFGLPAGTELARQIEQRLDKARKPEPGDALALAAILDELREMVNQKSAETPSP